VFRLLSDEQIDELYILKHGDWYEKIPHYAVDDWNKCDRCGVLPRCWKFNNGSYATCLCFGRYEEKPVRTESVLSVLNRTGLTAEYNPNNLRTQWNKYAADGVARNKLPEGQW